MNPDPAGSKREFLGTRAYARRRKDLGLSGTCQKAVQKALQEGRIFRSCPDHRRCPKGCSSLQAGIDPDLADADWEQWTSRPPGEPTAASEGAINMALKNRKLRLELAELHQLTLRRADVEAERLRDGKATLRELMLVCRRWSGRLATMSDPREIQTLTEDEIRDALDSATRHLIRTKPR
jgi:hypothetical protein